MVNQRAYLECGCSVWVGVRLDTQEPVTFATPCTSAHLPVMKRYNDLFRWSVADGGTDRPLLEVIDELLAESSRESGPGPD